MRSAIAVGWLIVAVLGGLCGSWWNLGPDDPLARLGMTLYALLLTVSLISAVLAYLKETKP